MRFWRAALAAAAIVANADPVAAQKVTPPTDIMPASTLYPMKEIAPNTRLRYTAGLKYLKQKDFAMAAAAFGDVVQFDQSNGNAHYLLGVSKLGLNSIDQAKTEFQVAARIQPNNPDPRGRLGDILANAGDVAGAQKQRDELAALDAKCAGKCPEAAGIKQNIAIVEAGLKASTAKAAPAAPAPPAMPAPQ